MKSQKRKICVVVTARATYSRVKSVLHSIENHPGLKLQLVVAASALLDRYGSAIETIKGDGFNVDAQVFNAVEGGNLTGQAKTTGLGIIELSNVFNYLQPDVVVTVADRYETMSTAITAAYMQIPLVHIQGGEVTGNIDDKVRHAITKLADLHLVATDEARQRVIRMGEDPQQVLKTGCPSIDLAREVRDSGGLDFNVYEKYGGVGAKVDYSNGYLVVMQHPVTNEFGQSRAHIEETLFAIDQMEYPTFWFWPNIDAGSDGTSRGIRAFRELNNPQYIHFFKNMEPNDFLKLILHAGCLIGNSSVGIRESSYLGVPVVNIGSRQNGRERSENVVDVDYRREEIIDGINRQVNHGPYPAADLYGQGDSGQQIALILAQHPISSFKRLMY